VADAAPRQPPRPWLLVTLGVVILALVGWYMWPAAGPAAAPSNPSRDGVATQGRGTAVTPQSLEVRLDALKQPAPQPRSADRNPFRFQPKPPPPPPAPPPGARPPEAIVGPVLPPPPAAPPGPPPIPLKFFGTLDLPRGGKVAALTDGKAVFKGKEGDIIDGRYRIVKIGVESIVLEYADGRGRTTIPLRGQ
jgi:hypothetical protein